ncbi:MAG: N-acyl-D-amino-acid deacylase family protein [Candidatus Helarchaeota archaeon]
MSDIIIKNGIIIDGTGYPAYIGSILIKKDTIQGIKSADYKENAEVIIDATKKVVCPGFIDVHSHYDFSYLIDKYANYSVQQGITTEIVGNCGLGLAPINEIVEQYYRKYITFFLGSLQLKPFQRIKDYMDYIEKEGCSLNVGFLVPQGNIRAFVIQMEDRYPTESELNKMKDLVKEGMEDGAFGLSTGLIYPPGSITTTQELIELAKVVGKYGGIYATHMRDEGRGVLKSINEAIEIGLRSGASVQISHVKAAGGVLTRSIVKKIINEFKNGMKLGVNITGDIYPYNAGNSVLSALLKPWVFTGGQDAFIQNLTNPQTRNRIIEEFKALLWEMINLPWFLRIIPKSLWMKLLIKELVKRVIITSMNYKHEFEGKTLKETIETLYPGIDPYNATLNLLREEEGAIIVSMFFMKRKDVLKLMKSPYLMFSTDNLSPGTGKPHPRVLGTYPRILGQCVHQLKLITLESAIHKMTGFPAKKFMINDRGTLKIGKKADIVIFDPNVIIDTSTHQNPISFPKGILKVIINGKIVVDNGNHTKELPGKVLKFNQ